MATNHRPHNNYHPYRLEADQKWIGCYEDSTLGRNIGRAMLKSGEASRYVVRGLDGRITDEGWIEKDAPLARRIEG